MRVKMYIVALFALSFVACSKSTSNQTAGSSSSSVGNTGVDLVCNQMAVTAAQNAANISGTTTSVQTGSFTSLIGLSNTLASFGLTDTSPIIVFENAADNFVQEKINTHITATPIGLGIQIRGNILIRDYQLSIEGAELCSNDLAVFERPNKPLWLKGRVPNLTGLSQDVYDSIPTLVYPTQDNAVNAVYTKLQLTGTISLPRTIKKCIIFENGGFTPALKITFNIDRKPYTGLATPEGYGLIDTDPVRSAAKAYLEDVSTTTTTTNGTATIAVPGSSVTTSGNSDNVYATQTVKLTGISSGGSLCSPYFVTQAITGTVGNPIITPSPIVKSENFTFPQSDYEFFEATTFANATIHYNSLLQNGYLKSIEGPQIPIVLNTTDNSDTSNNGSNNTAVFYPNGFNLTAPSEIELGNGDGVLLKNLWTDPDAVSHESGHPIIYTRLRDISDSIVVVIHEGYADSQVLLLKQSPCLCPTVCPTGSSVCFSDKCLRSAANNFTIAAPSCPTDGTSAPPECLPLEVHQRSQVISGMLWDFAQDIGPANNGYGYALQVVLDSISFLTVDSEYGEMLEALLKAEEDLGGKYQKLLLQEMCARGWNNTIQNTPSAGFSWMSQISYTYSCQDHSNDIPTGSIMDAPATSGAVNIPTTSTGGQ